MNKIILFETKEDCCGCQACYEVCPNQAIEWKQDEEGFYYPQINYKKCVSCKKCLNVCPLKNRNINKEKVLCLGGQNKNMKIRESSSSGGLFSVFAQAILNSAGSVFAVGFDSNLQVKHMEITEIKELDRVRRTKYVQSDINHTYSLIQSRLKKQKWVLFVGTPCQAQALINYLNKKYERLIIIDLICYGVPSPGIWEDYIYQISKKNKILNFNFRDKRNHNNGHTVSWNTKKQEHVHPLMQDTFSKWYFQNLIIRPSCHSCPFTQIDRNSDITLGDFWGIEKVNSKFNDGMGNSLIILHSKKAREMWEKVKINCKFFSCTKEDILQPRLKEPTPRSKNRNRFMKLYKNLPFPILYYLYSIRK